MWFFFVSPIECPPSELHDFFHPSSDMLTPQHCICTFNNSCHNDQITKGPFRKHYLRRGGGFLIYASKLWAPTSEDWPVLVNRLWGLAKSGYSLYNILGPLIYVFYDFIWGSLVFCLIISKTLVPPLEDWQNVGAPQMNNKLLVPPKSLLHPQVMLFG